MSISTNNYYKIRANFYDADCKRKNNPDFPNDNEDLLEAIQDALINSSNPLYYNVTTNSGMEDKHQAPCMSLEFVAKDTSTDNISEAFNCTFSSSAAFLNSENNLNGCIGFAWTDRSLEENSVPLYAHGSNYIEEKVSEGSYNNNYGLLGDSIKMMQAKGFTVSFYPEDMNIFNPNTIEYTTRIKHYIIAYRDSCANMNYIKGSFDESIDIYEQNTITVHHALGEYNIYFNEIYLATLYDNEIEMESWKETQMYFTASMMASSINEANLEIFNINYNGGDFMINEHIKNERVHLTPDEKKNLCNLATSVKAQGAYGDGAHDDTAAFVDALRESSRVYVPGGTYRITGELVVRDNCELELAQDAVLEFDIPGAVSSGEPVIDPDVGIALWDDERIKAAKKCITLNMLSSLVGNHATIRVPYSFDGIVIYASTRSHPDGSTYKNIPPFSHYCPQWKSARYLKDINIVKPIDKGMTVKVRRTLEEIERIKNEKGESYNPEVDDFKYEDLGGIHASVRNTCNGTAVFIEGHRNGDPDCSSHLWGLEFTGLRIAGAFEYGVYGTNNRIWVDSDGVYVSDPDGQTGLTEKWAWTNDMKINGIIDGCKTGVYLDHCNHAYISTLIQPHTAYFDVDAEEKPPYAQNGIYLNNCVNANLIGSRVWDWNATNTKWGPKNENQHIRLYGDCYGLILDDFLYYEMDEYDIRDLIYTNTPENFDTMSILQEPVTKYFKKSEEGKPLFNNGESLKELVLKDYFDEHFQTEKLYYYEDNILPDSKHDEDEELNEYGCVENMVISSATGKHTDANYITTGYIKCTPNTTLYFKGLDLCKNSLSNSNKIIYYYSTSEDLQDIYGASYFNKNNMVASGSVNYKSYGDSISSITVPVTDINNSDLVNLKYIRICCHVDDEKDPIVSTKPITCTPRGYITDNVYVKEEFVEKQTTINTDSTDNQIPSAKAVYDLLESALGEYVTDIACLIGGDA